MKKLVKVLDLNLQIGDRVHHVSQSEISGRQIVGIVKWVRSGFVGILWDGRYDSWRYGLNEEMYFKIDDYADFQERIKERLG